MGSCRSFVSPTCLLLIKLKMADRSWSGMLFNVVLVLVFVSLFTAIMHSKNLNKTLTEDIQQAQVDFQVYKDKAEICFKQLDTKVNEKTALDTQINDLTAKVAEKDNKITELTNNAQTLTDAKTNLDAQVAELTKQLEQAKADAAPKKEEAKEEPKTEEPKKEEPKTEA